MKKRYFSGIQPTGELHIGNYFGAIKSWIELQEEYEGIFGIVDYHAITEPYKPEEMPGRVIDAALDYLAAGVHPTKSILMIQSLVPEHVEMAWLLDSITPVSWVQRVPTYKEKSAQADGTPNMGLLGYPVLMAADIALYKSTIVPVGEDQLPHLELAREIVRTFNSRFGETFPEPQAYLGRGAKVMSLTEPSKKMSKSLGPHNYIALADEPDTIRAKIAKAVTDTGPLQSVMGPGVKNLFGLLKLFSTDETYMHFEREYDTGTLRYVDLKRQVADDVIKMLAPLREKRLELAQHLDDVRDILIEGSRRAREIASQTLHEAKEKMGLEYFN